MQQPLLPLFPLQLVLLPNSRLDLHIFEDRYKEMIGEAIEKGTEFGIVLAGEQGIVNTGCTAVVSRIVKQYPDGRLDIVAAGRRRFEILLLNEEKSYLRGAVEFFDDDDTEEPAADTSSAVQASYEELKALGALDDEEEFGEDTLSPLSFRVARGVPDLDFRQTMLVIRSEAERIRRLAEYLPGLLERLRTASRMRAISGKNGHGSHLGF